MTAMIVAYIVTLLMLCFLIIELIDKVAKRESKNDKLLRKIKEYEDKFNTKI